jgi:hypothetical protein
MNITTTQERTRNSLYLKGIHRSSPKLTITAQVIPISNVPADNFRSLIVSILVACFGFWLLDISFIKSGTYH